MVVVVGNTDTGKTTFCMELVNAAAALGLKSALVDADIGQSDIGPPGTIGLALPTEPVERLSDLHIRRMYFAGATSPVGNMLPSVVGAKKMADEAREHGASLIVVDTTGLVRGIIARKLKTLKIDLLAPQHIVAIQRDREIEPLITAFSKVEKNVIHTLSVPPLVRQKSLELRAARRRLRYAKHFEGAESHVIRLDDVGCWGTWLNTGTPLPWQRVRFLERVLKTRVLHAESVGRGFYIVVDRAPEPPEAALIEEQLGTREISIVPGSTFTNAYIGLADSRANTMDVGIVQAIEFRQRYVSIITKLKSIAPVRIIQFGLMRVKPDGTELAKLRPGEI